MPTSLEKFKLLFSEDIKSFGEYVASNSLRSPSKIKSDGSVIVNKSNTFATYVAFKNKAATIEELHQSLVVSPLKFKKIDRMSDKKIEDISKSFFGALLSSNMQFILRYGKELYLRDKKLFEEKLLLFVLINSGDLFMLENAANLIFNQKNVEDADLFMGLGSIALKTNNTSLYEQAFTSTDGVDKEAVVQLLKDKGYPLHSKYLKYFFDNFDLTVHNVLARSYILFIESANLVTK